MFYFKQNRIPRNNNQVGGDISGYCRKTKEGICGKNNDLEKRVTIKIIKSFLYL